MPRRILSDSQWTRVALSLPERTATPDDPQETIGSSSKPFCGLPVPGAPWRDLPDEFGLWNSVFQRFRRWARKGVFEHVFEKLSVDADFEYVLIDGTIVRLHQHGAGAKGGPTARRSVAREVTQARRSA